MIPHFRGPTVLRQTVSRVVTAQNTDWVMMAQPIPPGSTVNQISLDWKLTSKHSQDTWKWSSYTLHGCFVGFPNPNHGFGKNMSNYDTLWDNYVPKDAIAYSSLDQFTNDSHPDSSMTSTTAESTNVGAIESGNPDGGEYGEISGQLITVEDAPEVFFSRERMLDVTNGIIVDSEGDAGKYIQVDKYTGQGNKNYFLGQDRYWFALMAVGFPDYDATEEEFVYHPDSEVDWLHLGYPDISVLEAMITNVEDSTVIDQVRFGLETYYLEADTAHDLDEGDGAQEHVCTLRSTINYTRPKMRGLQLNANSGGL